MPRKPDKANKCYESDQKYLATTYLFSPKTVIEALGLKIHNNAVVTLTAQESHKVIITVYT